MDGDEFEFCGWDGDKYRGEFSFLLEMKHIQRFSEIYETILGKNMLTLGAEGAEAVINVFKGLVVSAGWLLLGHLVLNRRNL